MRFVNLDALTVHLLSNHEVTEKVNFVIWFIYPVSEGCLSSIGVGHSQCMWDGPEQDSSMVAEVLSLQFPGDRV